MSFYKCEIDNVEEDTTEYNMNANQYGYTVLSYLILTIIVGVIVFVFFNETNMGLKILKLLLERPFLLIAFGCIVALVFIIYAIVGINMPKK